MIKKLAACIFALETDAYLVGGSVRDWILYGKPGHDIDIAVSGDPKDIAEEIAFKLSGTVVPLSPEHGVISIAGLRDLNSSCRAMVLKHSWKSWIISAYSSR